MCRDQNAHGQTCVKFYSARHILTAGVPGKYWGGNLTGAVPLDGRNSTLVQEPSASCLKQKQTKKTTMREVNMDGAEAVAMFVVRGDGGGRCEREKASPRRIWTRLFGFPTASLLSPNQCCANLNPGDLEGRSQYLLWCRDSGPINVSVNGPSGEVPAVETRTNGQGPVKLPRRSCSGIAPTVVPCGDISCSICGALQDSCSCVFLGSFTASAWHSPPLFCPPFTPTTIFKWLEFNQNIHFLLNPFKAQCGAAVILLH